MDTEQDIIKKAKEENDQKAFKFLYTKYYPIIKKSVSFQLKKNNNKELIEDLTQEILSKALCRIEQYDSTYAFITWLNRIASNHVTDHFRKCNREAIETTDIDLNTLTIYTDKPTDYEMIHNQHLSELKTKLELLPDKYKYVLKRYYFDSNVKYEELAKELNMSLNNLKTYIFKAKKKLSKLVEQ